MKIKSLLIRFSSRGFTLIELLIVIAILGVLAAGILVAIDPIDKVRSANDAKVQNDVSGIGRASEAYAVTHGGFYEANGNELVTSGELKRLPLPPGGYCPAYGFRATTVGGGPCTGGVDCARVIIGCSLRSKKYYVLVAPNNPHWNYDTATGKSCVTVGPAVGCP